MIMTGKARALALSFVPLGWVLASFTIGAVGVLSPRACAADDVKFTATIDRDQISVDESVTLKLNVESSSSASVGDPQFSAPDFDLLNQYNEVQTQSYYDDQSGQ